MRILELHPTPPDRYSDAEKEAWLRGYWDQQNAGEGEDSLHVITPYDVDEEEQLYEAWEAGREALA